MALPFDTDLYDQIYLNISTELRAKFPQQQNEAILDWHRRLLFEFVSYIHDKYESETDAAIIQANIKNNKKRKNRLNQTNLQPTNTTMFDTNVERALDVVTQDPDFAVYLLYWWLPILISPTDYLQICLCIDNSTTPAEHVAIHKLDLKIQLGVFQLISINDIPIAMMTRTQFNTISNDPFVSSLFRQLQKLDEYNAGDYTIDTVKRAAVIDIAKPDPFQSSLSIAKILWNIKNTLQCMFISDLMLKSNLITTNLSVSKTSADRGRSNRKRFNSRKFMLEENTPSEMIAGVLQTVCISIFRTFYDYDQDTIDPSLFNYLILGQHDLVF